MTLIKDNRPPFVVRKLRNGKCRLSDKGDSTSIFNFVDDKDFVEETANELNRIWYSGYLYGRLTLIEAIEKVLKS
jgi:hypothetical protein